MKFDCSGYSSSHMSRLWIVMRVQNRDKNNKVEGFQGWNKTFKIIY